MARNPIIREHPANIPAPIPEETPHACTGGWVFLGFQAEDGNGEQVEEIEGVPCRRCRPKTL